MQQPQKLFLPSMIILDSDQLVVNLRKDLPLQTLSDPCDAERLIMEIVTNSLQLAAAAKQELEYNCHYFLQNEIPELFYFNSEQTAERLVAFGMDLLKLLELTRLFSSRGYLLYEFARLHGAALVLDRLDVDRNEDPANHPWTKGYQHEWTRSKPKHPTLVSRVHSSRFQIIGGPIPDGGAQVPELGAWDRTGIRR